MYFQYSPIVIDGFKAAKVPLDVDSLRQSLLSRKEILGDEFDSVMRARNARIKDQLRSGYDPLALSIAERIDKRKLEMKNNR